MGRLDEDLREVLRAKAASDAVYMWGGEKAAKKMRATEIACFNFIHQHAYEILGLYHLNVMAKDDVGSGAYAENASFYKNAELADLGLKHEQQPVHEPGADELDARASGAQGGAP